jgi:hypothetical protein
VMLIQNITQDSLYIQRLQTREQPERPPYSP